MKNQVKYSLGRIISFLRLILDCAGLIAIVLALLMIASSRFNEWLSRQPLAAEHLFIRVYCVEAQWRGTDVSRERSDDAVNEYLGLAPLVDDITLSKASEAFENYPSRRSGTALARALERKGEWERAVAVIDKIKLMDPVYLFEPSNDSLESYKAMLLTTLKKLNESTN